MNAMKRWVNCVVLLTAVMAFAFSFFKWDNQLWIAAWIAPVFLIRFMRTNKWIIALVLGFVALELSLGIGFLQMFSRMDMQTMTGNLNPSIIAEGSVRAGTMFLALACLVPFVLDKLLHKRLPNFLSRLVFPASWVTMELIYSFNVGTLYCLGQSQASIPPLVMSSAVLGMHGVSFLIAWLAPLINDLWEEGWDMKKLGVSGKVYAALMALILIFGAMSVVLTKQAEKSVPVAGIVLDAKFEERLYASGFSFLDPAVTVAEYFAQLRSPASHLDEVRQKTREAVKAGAKIIVWQEYALSLEPAVADPLLEEMRVLADEAEVYLLVSYARVLNREEARAHRVIRNLGILFTPDGRKAWEYEKAHPITGTEDYAVNPGPENIPYLDTPYGRIGQVICFDMHFPRYMRQAALDNIDILFSPSLDGLPFTPMATLNHGYRAVENGFTLVRVTGDGLSAVIDPNYRIWAAQDTFGQGTDNFYCRVPVISGNTFYSAVGFLFPFACAFLLITLVVIACIRIVKQKGAGPFKP